ncbi:hypothetical protein EKO23_07295 [Nocardioides guangzhouensis]|uniref:TRAP transporter substrate-binding protein DctP n=1 Tax=Nocardioides guangzhouensis TaxID=2497878 RepID=A0A4Q4ZGX3_9ACTN|nr:hypothetical protein [Nocardioides guangzhouensis]RYP87068.1 hypothetical protein EKO23_07295 [Nocardioides guangzhouensis]
MRSTTPIRTAALGLALLAGGLTACTDSSRSSTANADQAPTAAQPAAASSLVLRIGTDDGPETPAGAQITHFAEEVARLSDGSISVHPDWHAAGDGVPHWDQAVARMAARGDLDLAMVPARAWDALGVTSLTALNAPFLVDSDELTAAVVAGDLADDLMSGLEDAGVVGFGLFPEGLRHPFGFGEPLRGPTDYDGELVRSPHSRTTRAVFAALGARVTEADVDTSTQRGAESSYALTPAGVATGNVVFYPKVNSLVVNEDVRTQLSDEQWGTLNEAADRTRDWVLRTLPADNASAEEFCAEGGRIVAATPTDLADLRESTATVTASLRTDPVTAGILGRIEDLKESTTAAEPTTSCGTGGPSDDVTRLNGVYRTNITVKAFRAAGVTSEDRIQENAGAYTISLDDGTWEMAQVYATGPQKGETWHGTGSYTVEDGRLTWYWSHEDGAWTTADVAVQPDGSLRFRNHDDGEGPEFVLMSRVHFHHWRRVGDLP